MKRKEIKELLNLQVQSKTPKLSSKVAKTPLGSSYQYDAKDNDNREKSRFSLLPKWAYGVACAVVVCVLALSLGLFFGLPKKGGESKPQIVCYVVDINPSIAVTVNADGKVVYLSSQNADGDVVLTSDVFDNYKEMSAEECINAIIEQSARLGYIDCNSKDNKVTLTLVGDDSKNKAKVGELAECAQKFLRDMDVFAYVDTAAKDVKSFVESKGWTYGQSRLDAYLDEIRLESKYVCGANYGGDFESEAKEYINDYYDNTVNKKNFLNELGEKLEAVENANDISSNYWGYKLVEGTFLAPQISSQTAQLIKECDMLVSELDGMGVKLTCSADYLVASAKYAVVEEIAKFFDGFKEYIYDSVFFDLFLKLVDDEDVRKFQLLKEKIDGYYKDVVSKLSVQFKEKIDEYSLIFEGRRPISDYEYDEYLNSIKKV